MGRRGSRRLHGEASIQEPFMTNGTSISQKEVAGFLLGLGIGLVVGLLFQPQLGNGVGGYVPEPIKASNLTPSQRAGFECADDAA